MLSVQQKTSSMCITWVSASRTAETKRARMRAASNSSLGIVMGVEGATRVSAATRLVLYSSSLSMQK